MFNISGKVKDIFDKLTRKQAHPEEKHQPSARQLRRHHERWQRRQQHKGNRAYFRAEWRRQYDIQTLSVQQEILASDKPEHATMRRNIERSIEYKQRAAARALAKQRARVNTRSIQDTIKEANA